MRSRGCGGEQVQQWGAVMTLFIRVLTSMANEW